MTKETRSAGALLFLVYPLEVVGEVMRGRILKDIAESLEGSYGIKRYVGDFYWAADHKEKLDPTQRTVDFSNRVEMRNKLLAPGQEAQWCLFDPIMSAAYGRRYQSYRKERGSHPTDLLLQSYVPNDQTLLLWTQANLLVSLKLMEKSL